MSELDLDDVAPGFSASLLFGHTLLGTCSISIDALSAEVEYRNFLVKNDHALELTINRAAKTTSKLLMTSFML